MIFDRNSYDTYTYLNKCLLASQQPVLTIKFQLTKIFFSQSCLSNCRRRTQLTRPYVEMSVQIATPFLVLVLPYSPIYPQTDSTRVWTTIPGCSASFIPIPTYNIVLPSRTPRKLRSPLITLMRYVTLNSHMYKSTRRTLRFFCLVVCFTMFLIQCFIHLVNLSLNNNHSDTSWHSVMIK